MKSKEKQFSLTGVSLKKEFSCYQFTIVRNFFVYV